jgi:hypothetical protein
MTETKPWLVLSFEGWEPLSRKFKKLHVIRRSDSISKMLRRFGQMQNSWLFQAQAETIHDVAGLSEISGELTIKDGIRVKYLLYFSCDTK